MDDSYSRSKTSEHKRVIKCPNCNKTFKYYSRLQTHLDRKTPCNPVITIKDDYRFEKAQKERRVCEFCNRTFKSNQTMKIHLKKIVLSHRLVKMGLLELKYLINT